MKKLITLIVLLFTIGLLSLSSGCKKETTGTLNLDNYTGYDLYVMWMGTKCSVGPYDYVSYTVDAGTTTATAYHYDGTYFASGTFTLEPGGSLTLTLFEYKDSKLLSKPENVPDDVTRK